MPIEPDTDDRSRSEQEVFADLEALCRSPGYAHVIAYFYFRDNFIKIGEKLHPQDLACMHSFERLCRNEISVLLGLMVKGNSYLDSVDPQTLSEMIEHSEKLLLELHHTMNNAFRPIFMEALKGGPSANPFRSGIAQREPIFYSGESAYDFQFIEFALEKYRKDTNWFIANKRYSVQEAVQILKAVATFQNRHVMEALGELRSRPMHEWTLLPGFMFSIDDIHHESALAKEIISSFLHSFCCPEDVNNDAFNSIDDFNYLNAYPLIEVGMDHYLCFQSYGLAQAFYETPFFWMNNDTSYKDVASEHRGQFTEAFSKSRLESVFGPRRVYENVTICEEYKKNIAGEIDVLVLFGDRAIVLQAKSKKLTLEARKGNELALTRDFQLSVQDSYDQGLDCARFLLTGGYEFFDANGRTLSISGNIKEIYIACIVSDHYPGLNFQARAFLKYEDSEKIAPPLVTDVFFLDVLCEFLRSPLLLISYLNRRLRYMEQVFSFNEFAVLGYHLRRNLWIDDNQTFHLHDDIATDIDIAMLSRRAGLPGATIPPGLLTKVAAPDLPIGRILREVEHQALPSIIDFGLLVFTFSEETINQLNNGIKRICTLTARDGRQHDFTIAIAGTGITIHSNDAPLEMATNRLSGHCEIRKYACKASKWFGLLLSGGPDFSLRNGLRLEFAYEPSEIMDRRLAAMPHAPTVMDGKIHDFSGLAKKKIGRNDPCPCGSGKKFKRCCLI